MMQNGHSNQGIATEEFAVGYGKMPLIKDICLSVEKGKILTLIGPNGSGKSTILKSITRQLRPIQGVVYLEGTPMNTMKDGEVAQRMSMVMTERLKPELMTCREVAATGRYPYTGRLGILAKEDWQEVDQALAMVHAQEVASQSFLKISDGQKQRVMLARAICQNTQVMVLDEPTSYLDMRYKLDILENIRRMAREKNIAIIMSLHELDLAQKISDIIACVDGESICRIGAVEEIFSGDYIQKLYGIMDRSFDPNLGIMHLPANTNTPQYFIISGGGSGIQTFYQMQRNHIPFAVGILAENDIDYAVARAIASEVVSTRAYYPIEEEQLSKAKQLIDRCEACICTLHDFGPYNKLNQQLVDYAKSKGKYHADGKLKPS